MQTAVPVSEPQCTVKRPTELLVKFFEVLSCMHRFSETFAHFVESCGQIYQWLLVSVLPPGLLRQASEYCLLGGSYGRKMHAFLFVGFTEAVVGQLWETRCWTRAGVLNLWAVGQFWGLKYSSPAWVVPSGLVKSHSISQLVEILWAVPSMPGVPKGYAAGR